ncbi:MAG: YeeE/YedE family protein [Porticoccus sp.]|nr:YeeE/YedE family protein [Porticoccus sp.]MBQ0808210.1 YeeE/YedE family protein [Porticoccus sp.]
MKRTLSAFVAGAIFGTGLIISEMVNPKRVKGFLDVSGNWDPTLVFVMAGAFLVTGIGYKLVFFRSKPLFESSFSVPTKRVIDARLVIGAILFGMGWGLGGLCPGPAIVSAATLNPNVVIFVVAMIVGMKLFEKLDKKI